MSRITGWFYSIFEVCRRQLHIIFGDEGVLICFFAVCFLYPVLYALIYNPEIPRDLCVVAVDDSRTQLSRQVVREIDATPEMCVVGYAANMQEARRMMEQKQCYGIVHLPREFASDIYAGGQGHVSFYCDMSVLFRYKLMLQGLTAVQQDMCGKLQKAKIGSLGYQIYNTGAIIEAHEEPLGNVSTGVASAVLPFILVMVLQQSMILGLCMMRGGERERRVRNRGVDPLSVNAGVAATILGKTLIVWVLYVVFTVYVLVFVPTFFDFPQNADMLDLVVFILPFLLATSFMAQTLQVFVNDRESTFLVIAFTSVVFVFLTGVSWPRYAMSPLWQAVGNILPCTWACNGYVAMQSCGASLGQVKEDYQMLWVLAAFWFVVAYITNKFVIEPRYRRMRLYAEIDPNALIKEEHRRNAVDWRNWD